MTTPISLHWKTTTPEHRNDACACYMPPSDVNPIRSWHLLFGQQDMGPIMVKSENEANEWLTLLQTNHEDWDRIIGKYCTWESRIDCQIVERRRSLRYSDTPGGAWILLEELKSRGYMIAIATRAGITAVSAERYDEKTPVIIKSGDDFAIKTNTFEGPEPFSELAAMLFLTLNNCRIDQ